MRSSSCFIPAVASARNAHWHCLAPGWEFHGRLKHFRVEARSKEHDVWECPAGQHLKPIATDYERRLVRYRAPAHICNKCSIKHLCTASDEGREIEHHPDSWLQSELARFHRGISLALLILAELLLTVEMIRHSGASELLILGLLLLAITLLAAKHLSAFFASRPG
jgi:hypothetical protein